MGATRDGACGHHPSKGQEEPGERGQRAGAPTGVQGGGSPGEGARAMVLPGATRGLANRRLWAVMGNAEQGLRVAGSCLLALN